MHQEILYKFKYMSRSIVMYKYTDLFETVKLGFVPNKGSLIYKLQ